MRRVFSALPLLAAASVGLCQGTIVVPHILERNGSVLGVATSVSGGARMIELPPRDRDKPFLTPVDFEFYPQGNDDLLRRIVEDMQNPFEGSASWAVSSIRSKSGHRIIFDDAKASRIQIPALEQGAVDAPPLRFSLTAGDKTPVIKGSALGERAKPKKWMTSNFRLKIGNLPCSRVTTIGPISIRVAVGDLDGDGAPERYLQMSDFSVEVPVEDIGPYLEAFQASVLGVPQFQEMTLELFDGDAHVITLMAELPVISVDMADPLTTPSDFTKPKPKATLGGGPFKKGHVTLIK